jgi:uncharacterized protein (TIGR03382 family)
MGAEVDGVCSFVAEDSDPHEDCATAPECAERLAVCGDNGECKPCRCESKLDCADGYVCTADGRCEEAATAKLEGCSAAPSAPRSVVPTIPFLAAGIIAFRRRRRILGGRVVR